MARKGKGKADQNLLLALACGATAENAARQCGVSERTVYRRLSDPAFQQQLQGMRTDMVQRATGALTAANAEAARTLLSLQKETAPPAVRLGAARAILEISTKLREATELTERIAALEAQLKVTA